MKWEFKTKIHLIKTTHRITRTTSIIENYFPRFNKHSRHFINTSKSHSTVTDTANYETMSDPVIDNICTSSLSDVKEMANILGNKKNNKNVDKMCIKRTSHPHVLSLSYTYTI